MINIRNQEKTANQNKVQNFIDSREPIPERLELVKTRLNEIFSGTDDFMYREFTCGKRFDQDFGGVY